LNLWFITEILWISGNSEKFFFRVIRAAPFLLGNVYKSLFATKH
jgi:hypothetical protein